MSGHKKPVERKKTGKNEKPDFKPGSLVTIDMHISYRSVILYYMHFI